MNAPASTNGIRVSEIVTAPTIPIATAAVSETTAATTSVRLDRCVPNGLSVQFVQHVRAHAHRQEERRESRRQPPRVQVRSERGPDRDVGQVPRRVGRMEQRHEVPPPARAQRVERRALERWRGPLGSFGRSAPSQRVLGLLVCCCGISVNWDRS